MAKNNTDIIVYHGSIKELNFQYEENFEVKSNNIYISKFYDFEDAPKEREKWIKQIIGGLRRDDLEGLANIKTILHPGITLKAAMEGTPLIRKKS